MELNMYELAEQLKQLREEKKVAEQRVKDINADIDKTEYSETCNCPYFRGTAVTSVAETNIADTR